MSALGLIFAGTPAFAEASLRALIAAGYPPRLVLSQPDRGAGRGLKPRMSEVKLAALEYGIEVFQPETLRTDEVHERLRELKPELLVVAAYGLMLPKAVLDIPRVAPVNVHASLLPRWRGAAPIQAAILAGDTETGISLMRMDQGLDTGPVYARRSLRIGSRMTGGELHDRLAVLGGEVLVENLEAIASRGLRAEPQPEAGVTYAPRILKSDALIDWTQTAATIERAVRAYNPWPVSHTELDGVNLRCWRASAIDAPSDSEPGTIVRAGRDGLYVSCGGGQLRIEELQLAGKRRIAAGDFTNQRRLEGQRLGS